MTTTTYPGIKLALGTAFLMPSVLGAALATFPALSSIESEGPVFELREEFAHRKETKLAVSATSVDFSDDLFDSAITNKSASNASHSQDLNSSPRFGKDARIDNVQVVVSFEQSMASVAFYREPYELSEGESDSDLLFNQAGYQLADDGYGLWDSPENLSQGVADLLESLRTPSFVLAGASADISVVDENGSPMDASLLSGKSSNASPNGDPFVQNNFQSAITKGSILVLIGGSLFFFTRRNR